MHEVRVSLPRSAFTPRETARAGDVWRLFQDVAVEGSTQAGWPPERYRAEGVSFIVRSMVVLHHAEAIYGEPLRGRTWPSRFRRGMFFRRECRVESARGPIASATQEWVHVSADLALVKASDALVASFPVEEHEPPVELPHFEPIEGTRAHRFEFVCWETWMDPLGHVNHPAYVDFADEATSRAMREAGLDPVRLAPIAEEASFRSGIVAGERVTVETRIAGRTLDGSAVFEHRIQSEGRPSARVLAIRRLAGEDGESALFALR
jgi:acyl-CoA thioesterase FadM